MFEAYFNQTQSSETGNLSDTLSYNLRKLIS